MRSPLKPRMRLRARSRTRQRAQTRFVQLPLFPHVFRVSFEITSKRVHLVYALEAQRSGAHPERNTKTPYEWNLRDVWEALGLSLRKVRQGSARSTNHSLSLLTVIMNPERTKVLSDLGSKRELWDAINPRDGPGGRGGEQSRWKVTPGHQ